MSVTQHIDHQEKHSRTPLITGNIYCLLAAMAWSLGFPAGSVLMQSWDLLTLLVIRLLPSTIILLIYCRLTAGPLPLDRIIWKKGLIIGAIGFGIVTAILFYVITAACAAPATARFAFIQSLQPLRPVGLRLAVAIGSVVLVSTITGLTALYAVVLTMPILCLIQMVRRPNTGRAILSHFATLQKQSGD